ncbi:GNAT family N-acetyltransferase [Cytobacillus praedii]|uniref:GNAT family N-acetyltransferase n=1 Tax=Cytobacillus praedii TaxID=1742358 RepID=UPI002E23BD62|nr:GNAT family N-acetyltransferase [Cytobacillus praedii]
MNHNIEVEKFGIKLRPVTFEDAAFIYNLRTDPDNSQYIGDTEQNISMQYQWLESYFKRENDYYFCIDLKDNKNVGTIGIYNIKDGSGEWGRWVISKKYPVSPSSVWLIYEIAFNILNLNDVYCRTVIDNKKVISFHERCGLNTAGIEKNGVIIKGERKDLLIHTLDKSNYKKVQYRLEKSATFCERLLMRNE